MKVIRWVILRIVWVILLVFSLAGCTVKSPLLPTEAELVPETQETQPGTVIPVTPTFEQSLPPRPTATFTQQLADLRIAYIKDGDIWIWSRQESKKITHSGDVHKVRISPDGEIAAFLRPSGDYYVELWAVDLSGKNERLLVSIGDLNTIGGGELDPSAVAVIPYQFEWVPGTHLLAFNTQQVFQGPGLTLLDDFHLVDADTLELQYVLLPGWGGVFTISPDGEKVAISTPTEVYLANLDGADYVQALTYPAVTTYSDYRYYLQPQWTMDSQALRAAVPPVDPLAEPAQPTSLWLIPADGSGALQTGSVISVPYIESPVSFSPDLKHLVYVKESGEPASVMREIILANSDGSGEDLYQKEHLLRFEGWAADGKGFVFTTGEDQQFWFGSPGKPAQLLSQDLYNLVNIQWIDGQNFLFARFIDNRFALYLGNLQDQAILIDDLISSPPDYDFTPRYKMP